jgi:nitrogen regulatory protein PII
VKMMMIVYHKAADEYVIDALKQAGIRAYTKMIECHGEGTETEPKLGTHIWPGKNNILIMALQDDDVPAVTKIIRRLKGEHPRAGLKGFCLPMEETI